MTAKAGILALVLVAGASASAQETRPWPGADERTPSRAYYFDWINSQYAGSTEARSLVNLEFWRWLHDEYGMELDIYELDVGNIDDGPYTAGVGRLIPHHYGNLDAEEFRRQFPRGFAPLAAKAAEFGCRLGIWLGPDGFGDTPEEEQARIDMLVELCREHRFLLFKFDAVAGGLRADKQGALIRALIECRRHCPDLIALDERIDLGAARPYFTTSLWEGAETYIDVFSTNPCTAPHHRAGALARKLPPGLTRLIEDHGVCLSSCLDYWEDDLVLQVFNRGLILAPSIYGNPWLLRDEELPKLARLCNLARRHREILVNAMMLPEERYGPWAVSRGDGTLRFVTLRNLSWEPRNYRIRLDDSIGLTPGASVELRRFHPAEEILGRFPWGTEMPVTVSPFRACLLAAGARPTAELGVRGCAYEVVRDLPRRPAILQLCGPPGSAAKVTLAGDEPRFVRAMLDGREQPALLRGETIEVSFPGRRLEQPWCQRVGTLAPCPLPTDAEALYEATCFAADSDALEVRSLRRSGPTRIPQVERARQAFFEQPMFVRRGIWDRNLFDGDEETFFYAREADRALRLDLGAVVELDRLVLRTMSRYARDLAPELHRFAADAKAEYSADLRSWKALAPGWQGKGTIAVLDVPHGTALRYLRIDGAPRCLAEIAAHRGGAPLARTAWRASNLLPAYARRPARKAWSLCFQLEEVAPGAYLALALEGRHGVEGVTAALRAGDRLIGAPDRSPSFPSNTWEYKNAEAEGHSTYYFPLDPSMAGKPLEAIVLLLEGGVDAFEPVLHLTAYPTPLAKLELVLHRAE